MSKAFNQFKATNYWNEYQLAKSRYNFLVQNVNVLVSLKGSFNMAVIDDAKATMEAYRGMYDYELTKCFA